MTMEDDFEPESHDENCSCDECLLDLEQTIDSTDYTDAAGADLMSELLVVCKSALQAIVDHNAETTCSFTFNHLKLRLQKVIAQVEAPQQQGDPDCEICHGTGCPNCNDTMYYDQEAVVEQYRRDQAVDKARLLHPDEVGW